MHTHAVIEPDDDSGFLRIETGVFGGGHGVALSAGHDDYEWLERLGGEVRLNISYQR